MPEYLALIHFHEEANGEGVENPPPSVDEVEAGFERMMRAGIAKVH